MTTLISRSYQDQTTTLIIQLMWTITIMEYIGLILIKLNNLVALFNRDRQICKVCILISNSMFHQILLIITLRLPFKEKQIKMILEWNNNLWLEVAGHLLHLFLRSYPMTLIKVINLLFKMFHLLAMTNNHISMIIMILCWPIFQWTSIFYTI